MRISELSRRSGVPATTLRYYGDVGLLPATDRSPAGYRLYDDHSHQRLLFIEAAKRLRLSLSSIRDLLAVWESDTCRSVKRQLRPALEERIAEADAAIADLRLLRDELIAARSELGELPDRDQPCDPDCAFLQDDSRFSCGLDGDEYLDRAEQWHEILRGGERACVAGGVEVALPVERGPDLAALIRAEQTCCGFLIFTLRFEGPTVVMTLTAPHHAQRVVSDLTAGGGKGEPL